MQCNMCSLSHTGKKAYNDNHAIVSEGAYP